MTRTQDADTDSEAAIDVIQDAVPDDHEVFIQRNMRGDGRVVVQSPEDPISVDDDFAKGNYVVTPEVNDLEGVVKDALADHDMKAPLLSVAWLHDRNGVAFKFTGDITLED